MSPIYRIEVCIHNDIISIQVQMHEFIRSVASNLGHPGTTSRAQHIFDSAMQQGHYRWGRKAKLTAGASIAIALRESHKADSVRDIAVSPFSLVVRRFPDVDSTVSTF